MRKVVKIREIIKSSFEQLKENHKSNVIKWHDFNVIEIEIKNTIIGFGVNPDYSMIRIFSIKEDIYYESFDWRKYKPTFRIGIPRDAGIQDYWCVEGEEKRLISKPQDIHKIAWHFNAVNEVIAFLLIKTNEVSMK